MPPTIARYNDTRPAPSETLLTREKDGPNAWGTVPEDSGGGGSQPVSWVGPYVVTAADIDGDTGYAEVATPPAPSILVCALVQVTVEFDTGTAFVIAVGDPNGANLTAGTPTVATSAASSIDGAAVATVQEAKNNSGGSWVITDNTVNRVLFGPTGSSPASGSADIYLCYATPTAP